MQFYSRNEEVAAAMTAAGLQGAGADSLDQYTAEQPRLVPQQPGDDSEGYQEYSF